ncbi:MAG: glycosyltransferase family 9 protein [Ignavibacteriales bacterium]|nr:glycosyltransferase family 9 protein [Ignavibacteriales bacterium]
MKTILKHIEIAFRHAIVYPLLKLFFRNPIRNDRVAVSSVSRLLILRDDGIGDMIVSTPMLRKLKEANPSLKLDVVASARNAEVIKHNPFVDELIVLPKTVGGLWKELRRLRSKRYDMVINFVFNRTTAEGILANIVASKGIKVGQGMDKYQFYFNRLLKLDRSQKHMVEVLAGVIDDVFGTDYQHAVLQPEVFIDDRSHSAADSFLHRHHLSRRDARTQGQHYVVINFSAVDVVRRMSEQQVVNIVKLIRAMGKEIPVLIYPPSERIKLRTIFSRLADGEALVFPEEGTATLLELASLIEGSRYVVTCDTSVVHFAAAAKTPVFVLFTPTAAKNHEWTPYGVPHACLYAQLGSGVDSLSIDLINRELTSFLARVE